MEGGRPAGKLQDRHGLARARAFDAEPRIGDGFAQRVAETLVPRREGEEVAPENHVVHV
jgi:hypothetical protein